MNCSQKRIAIDLIFLAQAEREPKMRIRDNLTLKEEKKENETNKGGIDRENGRMNHKNGEFSETNKSREFWHIWKLPSTAQEREFFSFYFEGEKEHKSHKYTIKKIPSFLLLKNSLRKPFLVQWQGRAQK